MIIFVKQDFATGLIHVTMHKVYVCHHVMMG